MHKLVIQRYYTLPPPISLRGRHKNIKVQSKNNGGAPPTRLPFPLSGKIMATYLETSVPNYSIVPWKNGEIRVGPFLYAVTVKSK